MKSTLMRWVGGAVLMLSLGAALASSAALAPVGPATFRWQDIGDYVYGTNFRATYAYSNASVNLAYSASDSSFTGTLSGGGLKPNFAYQLKLEGKPATLGGTPEEDWTNEQLGYAGRWWMDTYLIADNSYVGGGNSTDTVYDASKAAGFQDSTYRYVFKGYLMFDYVVTTATGAIPGTNGWGFVADSSFHVLWKTTQRAPTVNDSVPTSHTLSFKSTYYDTLRSNKTVSLYGEWEPTRDLPGQLLLPLGTYRARLVLTEESFHTTQPSLGGAWAAALAADVSFVISSLPPPPPGALSGTVKTTSGKAINGATITVCDLAGAVVASAKTLSTGKYSITGLAPASYNVTAGATGYQAKSASATILSGVTKTLDFRLSR
jgi:hypothetical protein